MSFNLKILFFTLLIVVLILVCPMPKFGQELIKPAAVVVERENFLPVIIKELVEYNLNEWEAEQGSTVYLVEHRLEDKKGFLISNKCGRIYLLVDKHIFNKQLKYHEMNYKWLVYVAGQKRNRDRILRVTSDIYVLTTYDYETDYINYVFNLDNIGDFSMIAHLKMTLERKRIG